MSKAGENRKWGNGMKGCHDEIADRGIVYAEASLFAGGAVCSLRRRVGSPGACRKERSLAKVWLTSILLQSISGDEYYSSSFMRQRMGIWRVCV